VTVLSPESMRSSYLAQETLDRLLPWVQKPGRYTGGEWNSIHKVWDDVSVHVALAFPDVYEMGMSNLGLAILYDILNSRANVLAERVYAPWVDMETVLRRERLPLFSIESRRPIRDFDILGFSLAYEQLFTNVLNMLDLSEIPLRTRDRDLEHPLVIAGGCGALNPEPMHAFIDAFVIGDGEEAVQDVVIAYSEWKRLVGSEDGVADRMDLLRLLARIPGVYVPVLYETTNDSDGLFQTLHPVYPDVPPRVTKRVVSRLPQPVKHPIVPFVEPVHDRAVVEIQRGCSRGCRFCQAGMVYRPIRERSVDEVLHAVRETAANTGFDEVAFLSLSASDYSGITELVDGMLEDPELHGYRVSLPSLRIESFSVDLLDKLARTGRRGGFTFAPEAATDRLRRVINKPIDTDAMLQVADDVFSRGWTTLKLYFMIGHPTQTAEDVAAVVSLARRVRDIGRSHCGKRARVRVSASTFVPKPHTPFQWEPLEEKDELQNQIALLRRGIRGPSLDLSWNDPTESLIEATLARGDRQFADVIERAWQSGAKFDAWQEHFDAQAWHKAFEDSGLDPERVARRQRKLDEHLPWDHIDVGVRKEFLAEERHRSQRSETSADCREICHNCGVVRTFGQDRGNAVWGCPPRGDHSTSNAPRASRSIPGEERSPRDERAGAPEQRQRLVITHGETIKYISHLDMMRMWTRALRRAKLPLSYTKGFHPQPRLQFAAPLPVSFSACEELIDVWLDAATEPRELLQSVRLQLPRGAGLVSAMVVPLNDPSLPSQVRSAEYCVIAEDPASEAEMADRVVALLAADQLLRQRRRKGKLRSYDLRPLVLTLEYNGMKTGRQHHSFHMHLRLESAATGRPDEVLDQLGLGGSRYRTIERVRLHLSE